MTQARNIQGRNEAVAVVGIACRLPGGDTPDAFWDFLARGGDAVTEIPPERWNVDDYYDPDPEARGKMYTRRGAFIPDFDQFSASFFGISPREAQYMDPQQRQLLEVHWEALESAGIAPQGLAQQQVGVFVGMGTTDYGDLQAALGPMGADAYNGTGGSHAAAAGRLSYLLGVRGPSLAVDTACSSSLVSVHLAMMSLRGGESDIALASGVNLNFAPDVFIGLCKARMLSPDGRCKTFDARANGYVRGEGCGVLVLKRLSDAVADGDNIFALLRGSATNHNGRSSGLTVPSGPAQQEVIRTALRNGGVDPSEVGFLEAHGTGTAVGDPIEAGALGAVFAGRSTPLLVGSVKTNCGHLEWAAGVCGLIKAILSMDRGVIPANLHFEQPNPMIPWDRLPIRVVAEATPWPAGHRICGVSSFGFGGANAHVVVEQAPARAEVARGPDRPLHVLALSAKSEAALRQLADRMADAADRLPADALPDLCYSANAGRSRFDHRLAVTASASADLAANLRGVSGRVSAPAAKTGREPQERPLLAMMFTGQGSQQPDMGRALFETQPVFRETLEACDALLADALPLRLLEVLYGRAQAEGGGPVIDETAYAQPALFAVEYALAQMWRSWGVEPDVVLGHSVGEYVAACLAGVFDLQSALKLVAARGALMQALPRNGAMLAVRAAEARVLPLLAPFSDLVSLAAVNGPNDVVVSGEAQAVEAIAAALIAQEIPARALNVSHAFHSPLMEPMLAQFAAVAAGVSFQPPSLPVISNVTGQEAGDEIAGADYWVQHIRGAVRFADSVASAAEMGCGVFVEAGPQPVLCGLGRECLPGSDALWLPSLRARRDDWTQLLDSVAELWAHGGEIDWAGFDRGYARRKLPLPTYPFERRRFWFPGGAAGSPRLTGALRPLVESLTRSPLVKETVASTTLGIAAQPYLADHKVHDQVVAPGATYLSMLASAAELMDWPACRIEDVYFLAPLILNEREGRQVQAVLTPLDGDEGAQPAQGVQIAALPVEASGEPMVRLLTGRMRPAGPTPERGADLASLQARCRDPFDTGRLYEIIIASGVEVNAAFRWVDRLWMGQEEALAELTLPEAVGSIEGYKIHPALLDAGFQVAGALLGEDDQTETFLPFAVKAMRVERAATGTSWWCHAVRTGPSIWDIRFLDSEGETLAALEGFEMRKAPAAAFLKRRLADWLYRIEWRRQDLATEDAPAAAPATWLLLDNGSAVGSALAARIRARGDRCVVASEGGGFAALESDPARSRFIVDPASPGDLSRLIEACALPGAPPCAGVVHLWSLWPDGAGTDPADRAEALATGLLHVLQATMDAPTKPRPFVVTRIAQAVASGEAPNVAQAPLWGMARTILQESPELHIACIDLERDAAEEAEPLLAELGAEPLEGQVAWRGGERHVARFARCPDAAPATIEGSYRLQLREYGSPDNLQLVPMARQKPGRNQVEITVKATALNFRDVIISLGMLREFYEREMGVQRAQDIPLGFDCAGVVSALGEGVTDLAVGDVVMAPAVGSFASHVIAFRDGVMPVPEGLDFATAASLPSVYWTAYHALVQLAGLKRGERVLIHAAAGGVGVAAIQIAQSIGAEIFATASPGKWDYLRSQGVNHIMNSRTLDFAEEIMAATRGEGVDVVLNSLGGAAVERSFSVLRQGGRFVEIGRLEGGVPPEAVQRPDAAYFTFELGAVIARDMVASIQTGKEICALFETGALRPPPLTVFSIDRAAEAYRYMQQTRHIGKCVMTLDESPVRAEASYLVTGGLGGLGLKIAESLVAAGARNLVLAGRRGADEAAERAIEAMRAAGARVEVMRGDVSKPEDAAAMVALCQEAAPLRGIVHAAGVLVEGLARNQSAESYATVLAPKVRGGWELHRLTRDLRLDFFVSFSSMASVTGSPGQTNYAAANAFLDALATARRVEGLAGSSLAFGPWAEVGMAAGLEFGGGIEKLSVDEGLHAMRLLLRSRRGTRGDVGVMKVRWDAYAKRWPAPEEQSFLSELTERKDGATAEREDILRQLRAAPQEDQRTLLEAHIQEAVRQVLGLPASYEIRNGEAWTDLGVDSLMMVEIKNRLEASLKVTFPLELLMRDVSVNSVVDFVLVKFASTLAEAPDQPAPAAEDPDSVRYAVREELKALPQCYAIVEAQRGRQVLIDGRWRCDLASCNYLGFDLEPEIQSAITGAVQAWGTHPSWTRAVASPSLYDELERELANTVGAPETLVFPSISLLHLGVLPALAGMRGVILTDESAHYSIAEACMRARFDGTEWVEFRHNDVEDLTAKLARYPLGKTKIICTDGVYSMGSPNPPLADYARLAREYNATLCVDDAHGFGIVGADPDEDLPYGYGGVGIVRHLGLDYERDRIVYVAGMSKAFSSYAAFVTCQTQAMKQMLQTSGPYVFSGPTAVACLATGLAGLRLNRKDGDERRRRIHSLTARLVRAAVALGFEVDNDSNFPIVGVVIGGWDEMVSACRILWDHDILITPATFPAVPATRNLVRFSITSANTDAEIDLAIAALKAVQTALHPAAGPGSEAPVDLVTAK